MKKAANKFSRMHKRTVEFFSPEFNNRPQTIPNKKVYKRRSKHRSRPE